MHEDWHERWRIGRTGWHELEGNRNLQKYWTWSGRRVLVPLCGKTRDLLWLESQGNDVVGVELSEIAVRAFFEENALDYDIVDAGLPAWQATDRNITICCGDFFEFRSESFDAHYDRGALGALAGGLRGRYASHVSTLLTSDAEQFVITVEYDQSVCDGPPYSISDEEIRGYWPRLERLAVVDDTLNAPPKFREAGLASMFEIVRVTGRQG